jgi:putative nucleotidyltransferase with HDIG domain
MKERICLRGVSHEVDGMAWDGFNLVRIGRQAQSELQLNDSSISRCHAELAFVDSQGWFVRDLGSTNGTFLNGIRVGPEECKVRVRDLLQVGNVVMRVAGMDQAEVSTVENFYGTMHVEATAQHSWEQAFAVVARHVAQHPESGSQLLGLLRSGHALHNNHSFDELLQGNLEDAVRALGARRGALLLADEMTGQLTLHASTGKARERPAAAHYSRTLVQRCLARGESLLSSDLGMEADWRSDSINNANASSILCALLRSPQRRLGVLYMDRGALQMPFSVADLHLADAVAASIAGSIESGQFLLAKQRSWFIQTVITLAQTIELRDPYTAGHAERVTEYALLLAEELKLPAQARQQIEIGGPLHDIGKIGVRDSVLSKQGRLSDDEYEHMKSHTVKGAAILATIPDLEAIVPIIRNHHERWDGRGYPDRLAGEGIPLVSRIVAVADAFDAMTSNRPYRSPLTLEAALEQLRLGIGTQFDPQCARAFLNLRQRLDRLVESQAMVDTVPDVELVPAQDARQAELVLA